MAEMLSTNIYIDTRFQIPAIMFTALSDLISRASVSDCIITPNAADTFALRKASGSVTVNPLQ